MWKSCRWYIVELEYCQFGIFSKLTVSPFFDMQTNHFYHQGQLEPITDTYCAELTPDLCPDQKRTHWKKKLVCDQFIFQRPVNDIGISKIFQFPNHFLVINWLFKKWFYMSGGELVELWLRETQLVDTFLNDDCTNRNCAMVNIATAQIR